MITVKIFLFKGRNEESNIRELYEYYKRVLQNSIL